MFKWPIYLYARTQECDHAGAKHIDYCDCGEDWLMHSMSDDDADHFLSFHIAKCNNNCGYESTHKRAWPKWMNTYEEAYRTADQYSGD